MACKRTCQLCNRLVLSQAVAFADGTLTINLPAGNYNNNEQYCIVIAQAIPEDTTIIADVVFTIGTGTAEYPFTACDCSAIIACAIRTRTKYPVRVITTPTGGSFRLLGKVACSPNYNLTAIDGTAPEEGGATNETSA